MKLLIIFISLLIIGEVHANESQPIKAPKALFKDFSAYLPQAVINEGNYLRLLTGFIKADIMYHKTYFGGEPFTQKHIKGVHECVNQVLWGKLQKEIVVGKTFSPDYVKNLNSVATHPLFAKCFKKQGIYKDLCGYIKEENDKIGVDTLDCKPNKRKMRDRFKRLLKW